MRREEESEKEVSRGEKVRDKQGVVGIGDGREVLKFSRSMYGQRQR